MAVSQELLQRLAVPSSPEQQTRPKNELAQLANPDSPTVRAIAARRAAGAGQEDLAREFKIEPSQIYRLCQRDWFTRLVLNFQSELFKTPEERIKAVANHAIETKYMLMLHGTDQIKDRVSTDFLDRALGKATQYIESTNHNTYTADNEKVVEEDIKKLQERIEAMEAQRKKLFDEKMKQKEEAIDAELV